MDKIVRLFHIIMEQTNLKWDNNSIVNKKDKKLYNEFFKIVADVDYLVCAEISDLNKYPKLYHTIKTLIIHGPCGS